MIKTRADMPVEIREKMRNGAGRITLRHFFKPEEFKAPVRLCASLLIPPGSGIGLHAHGAEDEVYVILRGEGLLDEGKGKRKVSVGDAILTGHGDSHSIENQGSQDLELLAFIATYPEPGHDSSH